MIHQPFKMFLVRTPNLCATLCTLMLLVSGPWNSVKAQPLEDLQKEAAEQHHSLQAAYHRFEASVQRAEGSGVLPDPTFSFKYFISPIETRVGAQRAGVSLAQQFPWFGKLKTDKKAAAYQAEAQYAEFVDLRNRIFTEVAEAYYILAATDERILVSEENIKLLHSIKNITETNFSNDRSSLTDVLRLEIAIEQARTDLKLLREQRQTDLYILNKAMHREEIREVRAFFPEEMPEVTTEPTKGEHPTVKAAEMRRNAANAAVESAQKSGKPNIGLGLDYVWLSERPDMPDLKDNGRNVIMPMVSLSLPIYRKRVKSAVREQQLLAESYQDEMAAAEFGLGSDQNRTTFELNKSRTYLDLYERQVRETEKVMELLTVKFSNTGSDYTQLLEVRRELLRYNELEIDARKNYFTQLAAMQYLTATYKK